MHLCIVVIPEQNIYKNENEFNTDMVRVSITQ